jgi:hypothetical protein
MASTRWELDHAIQPTYHLLYKGPPRPPTPNPSCSGNSSPIPPPLTSVEWGRGAWEQNEARRHREAGAIREEEAGPARH